MSTSCNTVPDAFGEASRSFSASSAVAFSSTEQRRIVSLASRNLEQLGMPRLNVLFIGADPTVWRLLATTLQVRRPLVTWRPGEPMHLPECGLVRTVFIPDVGDMSGAEQVRLLEWLNGAVGRTQVISTSRAPLMPLVDDGRFLNSLYYRLNTIDRKSHV